ncbi:class I SAM-dependent methyltransferase [Stomatohabitans albus]|uniref:class I SAM-dependent methyltransferase n=1 Tax=Stomatohabitans albus TaxID=3110766 RepID=UPI00300C81E9
MSNIVTGNHHPKYGGIHTNPCIGVLTNRFVRHLERMVDTVSPIPATILDVGCAEGTVARRLAQLTGASVTGFDLPDTAIESAWANGPGPLVTGDAHELPFEDNHFDLVLGLEVLEHVADPHQVLAEMVRVTKGPLILSVPNEPFFRMGNLLTGRHVRSLGNTPGHWNHWTPIGFQALVSKHAALDEVRHPFPWTLVRASADL